MPFPSHIFRAYDIRGLVDSELTLPFVSKLGEAFATFSRGHGASQVVIGQDNRSSSARFADTLQESVVRKGLNVVRLGMHPTPLFYFSVHHFPKSAGVMVTASHNPKEYNGFKMMFEHRVSTSEDYQKVKECFNSPLPDAPVPGQVTQWQPLPLYIDYLKHTLFLGDERKEAVLDTGNGAAGPDANKIFKEMGVQVIPLFIEPDEMFPNHIPDPFKEETLSTLSSTVRERKADLGIALDGDGDRFGMVDERGNIVRADRVLGLLADEFLRSHPGGEVLLDVKCSQGVMDFIQKKGGKPVMGKTGHTFLKERMARENILLGGELSGHFFFRDDYFGYDDGIYSALRLLRIATRASLSLSRLVKEIPDYPSTPEIHLPCPDSEKFRVMEHLKSRFLEHHSCITVDGVRVQYPDGWGLLRASNTSPLLTLRLEAKTSAALSRIRKEFREQLQEIPELEIPKF